MSAIATPLKQTTTKKQVCPPEETLLESKYPLEVGCLRKIVNVFDNFYRINCIDRTTGFIVKSSFVKVENGVVKEGDQAFV